MGQEDMEAPVGRECVEDGEALAGHGQGEGQEALCRRHRHGEAA